MLTSPTLDQLHTLGLGGMARALAEQREQAAYAALGFEERLGLLVDREVCDRDNWRLERNLEVGAPADERVGRGSRLPPAPRA